MPYSTAAVLFRSGRDDLFLGATPGERTRGPLGNVRRVSTVRVKELACSAVGFKELGCRGQAAKWSRPAITGP